DQCPGCDMRQVARNVERQPAVAEQLRLDAVVVRHGDDQHPAGPEQRSCALQLLAGIREMLKRVPEHDRRIPALDLAEVARAYVGADRLAFEAGRRAATRVQRVEQGTVAGADVEHRSGWGDFVQSPGELAPEALQEPVADAAEAARVRPVPGRV